MTLTLAHPARPRLRARPRARLRAASRGRGRRDAGGDAARACGAALDAARHAAPASSRSTGRPSSRRRGAARRRRTPRVAVEPGWLLGIETADCLPVLLVDPRRRAVAAAHAGWRGTAAGVVRRAVEALVARGSRPADLAGRPRPRHRAVLLRGGRGAARGLRARRAPPSSRRGLAAVPTSTCARRTSASSRGAGVRPERDRTTSTSARAAAADLYHSYRRDGRGAGRMISFVGFARG